MLSTFSCQFFCLFLLYLVTSSPEYQLSFSSSFFFSNSLLSLKNIAPIRFMAFFTFGWLTFDTCTLMSLLLLYLEPNLDPFFGPSAICRWSLSCKVPRETLNDLLPSLIDIPLRMASRPEVRFSGGYVCICLDILLQIKK